MDFENEINDILNNILINDIKNIDDINDKNIEVVDIVYSNFIKYKKNEENIKQTKEKIKNKMYEYIDSVEDLNSNDAISSLNLNNFYNLKFTFLGFFCKKIDEDTLLIKSITNKFWKINKNKHIFFRKLNAKDKVNIMLVDTINKL